MRRIGRRKVLVVPGVFVCMVISVIGLIFSQGAYATHNPECRSGPSPCVDIHTLPDRGRYYGTLYVDGYYFLPYSSVTLWYNGKVYPSVIQPDIQGKFSVVIPPGCYNGVTVQALEIYFGGTQRWSNIDYAPSIC